MEEQNENDARLNRNSTQRFQLLQLFRKKVATGRLFRSLFSNNPPISSCSFTSPVIFTN